MVRERGDKDGKQEGEELRDEGRWERSKRRRKANREWKEEVTNKENEETEEKKEVKENEIKKRGRRRWSQVEWRKKKHVKWKMDKKRGKIRIREKVDKIKKEHHNIYSIYPKYRLIILENIKHVDKNRRQKQDGNEYSRW